MENILGVGGELFESWCSWDTLLSKDTADVIFVQAPFTMPHTTQSAGARSTIRNTGSTIPVQDAGPADDDSILLINRHTVVMYKSCQRNSQTHVTA